MVFAVNSFGMVFATKINKFFSWKF